MTAIALITNTAATLARQLVRPPLVALDDHVVRPRLGDGSSVHRALSTAVGLIDSLTDDADRTSDAGDDVVPTDRARMSPEPTRTAPRTENAADEVPPAERDQIETLTEDLLDDQQDSQFVGELGDEELRRVQAQVRAKQLIEDPDHT